MPGRTGVKEGIPESETPEFGKAPSKPAEIGVGWERSCPLDSQGNVGNKVSLRSPCPPGGYSGITVLVAFTTGQMGTGEGTRCLGS